MLTLAACVDIERPPWTRYTHNVLIVQRAAVAVGTPFTAIRYEPPASPARGAPRPAITSQPNPLSLLPPLLACRRLYLSASPA